MKRLLPIFLLTAACAEKEIPTDFNERILDLVVETRNGRTVELPDLYTTKSYEIPEVKGEKLILSEKLQARGFTITQTANAVNGLSGVRSVTQTLPGQCRCEVTKTYVPTAFINEFTVSEKIKCQ